MLWLRVKIRKFNRILIMLDNRIEIEAWLKEYKVIKYTINEDFVITAKKMFGIVIL